MDWLLHKGKAKNHISSACAGVDFGRIELDVFQHDVATFVKGVHMVGKLRDGRVLATMRWASALKATH